MLHCYLIFVICIETQIKNNFPDQNPVLKHFCNLEKSYVATKTYKVATIKIWCLLVYYMNFIIKNIWTLLFFVNVMVLLIGNGSSKTLSIGDITKCWWGSLYSSVSIKYLSTTIQIFNRFAIRWTIMPPISLSYIPFSM